MYRGCSNIVSVPVCPVITTENIQYNTNTCFSSIKCPVGTNLTYTCTEGYVALSTTPTCLANHTWSIPPKCIPLDDAGTT